MNRNYDVIHIISTCLLRRPRVVNFAVIIKIPSMFTCLLKKAFKDLKKGKRIRTYVFKFLYFFICISSETADFQ